VKELPPEFAGLTKFEIRAGGAKLIPNFRSNGQKCQVR
jgi:hypothetical protein